MTHRDATALQIQLDAMRLARAEDEKRCRAQDARIKELEEEEVARLRGNLQAYQLSQAIDLSPQRLAEGTRAPRPDDLIAKLEADRLAEGTRDEEARRRCHACRTPLTGNETNICRWCEGP